MMNIKTLLTCLSLSLMMVGCTESETLKREVPADKNVVSQSSVSEDAASVLASAKSTYAEAKVKQHSWTITAKMLEAAEKALATGDEDAAMIAAKRALFTAEASLIQAETQEAAWQARVPQ
jgi:hypothetical protein